MQHANFCIGAPHANLHAHVTIDYLLHAKGKKAKLQSAYLPRENRNQYLACKLIAGLRSCVRIVTYSCIQDNILPCCAYISKPHRHIGGGRKKRIRQNAAATSSRQKAAASPNCIHARARHRSSALSAATPRAAAGLHVPRQQIESEKKMKT
jgi:hypothetical protein